MIMNSSKKVKLVGTILGILMFILLTTGITYAWFTWQSNKITISGTSECFIINYTKGKTLSNESAILFDESTIITNNQITVKEGMALTDVTASIDSNCDVLGNLTLNLTVSNLNSAFTDSGNSTGAFKYVLASYDPSSYDDITASALSGVVFDIIKTDSITSTDTITLVSEQLSTTKKGYLLIFYVDGDLANDDAQNSTFSATIEAVARQVSS